MNVFLINPSQDEVYGVMGAPEQPPLSLGYLGAVLEKAGHRVEILDVDAEGLSDGAILAKMQQKHAEFVGITTVTPTFQRAVRMCGAIKAAHPSVYTAIGGIHPTILPGESAEPEAIDFVVKGEAEETIVELLEALEGRRDFSSILGLLYKEDGRIVENPPRPLIPDIDVIPFPSWHLFNQHNYTYPGTMHKPVFPIFTSRGCPANCTYCQTKNIFTRRFRARSAQNVVEEIEWLVRDWGAREIHIWDDNFTTQKKRVFQIRDEIKRRGIKVKFAFPNGLRADYVNEEVLWALKDMGVYSISYGIESGNDEILKIIEKGETCDRVRETVRLTKKVGLEIWGFFMIGLPGETAATIQDTITFAKELDVDVAKFHILQPYPGSKVFYQLEEQGLITDKNFANYGIHTRPVHRLKDLDEDDILGWQKRAYRQFYLRPKKIWQHLRQMNTWYRIKLNTLAGLGVLKVMFQGNGGKRWLGEFDTPVRAGDRAAVPGGYQEPKEAFAALTGAARVERPGWSAELAHIEKLEKALPEETIARRERDYAG